MPEVAHAIPNLQNEAIPCQERDTRDCCLKEFRWSGVPRANSIGVRPLVRSRNDLQVGSIVFFDPLIRVVHPELGVALGILAEFIATICGFSLKGLLVYSKRKGRRVACQRR